MIRARFFFTVSFIIIFPWWTLIIEIPKVSSFSFVMNPETPALIAFGA
jgi:hypothetical protein